MRVRLEERAGRAICVVTVASEDTHNCVIVLLCLSRGRDMSVTVGTLQDLQCLEGVWCQPVALL
jgi:hypothetical protein